MINQRLYTTILLGYGTGTQTIARYGCFMISVLDGLRERGLSVSSVGQWNEHLKSVGVYTPQNPTLINVVDLGSKSKYFVNGRKEVWNDAKVIDYLSKPEKYIVLGEVSAKGIGGTGQHFVKLVKVDHANGKVTMTYVDDPWDGLSNQKVTTRYGNFGNVLSLRVLELKEKEATMPDELLVHLGVPTTPEAITKLVEHLGEVNGKSNWGAEGDKGGHLGSERAKNTALRANLAKLQTDLTTMTNNFQAEVEAHKKTQLALTECLNKPITPPVTEPQQGRLNGYTETYELNGKTRCDNYTIDP